MITLNISLLTSMTMNFPMINKVTKHINWRNRKAMKPYIDIADDIKIQAMNKFNLL